MFQDYLPTSERPGKILIVDDLPEAILFTTRELRPHPFEVATASSAAEALELCARKAFEGIVMDVSLVGMDGIEACRRIRQTPLNRRTPLIFLSGVRIGMDWITEGIEAGGIDYLTKPYQFPEFLAKLRMMVRLSRQDQAAMVGERQRALLDVAGAAAHELSQPLASARLIVDQCLTRPDPPARKQMQQLHASLDSAIRVLNRIQRIHTYVTKPYAEGQILDLDASSRSFLDADPDEHN